MDSYSEPATIWRLRNADGDRVRATLIPGAPTSTLCVFVNDRLERGENFMEWEPALARAAELREGLLADGWTDD